jgi:hypothetical protein
VEIAKEIVIAMIQNDYIYKGKSNEENVEAVKKAYDAIYQQIRDSKNTKIK